MPRRAAVEHDEFGAFYERHYRLVVGFFRSRGLSGEESRDLAQDTFLGAYRGFGRFRGESSRKTWLMTIAANTWRNRLRDRSAAKRDAEEVSVDLWAQVEGEVDDDHQAGPASPESPLEATLDAERKRALREASRDLPKQMKRCFYLYFYQGRKYREIAALLGVSIDTVKSQIHQAKAKLRRQVVSRFAEHPIAGGGE